MKKTILSLVSAAAIGIGALTAAPQQANAAVWWVAPAIVGAGVVGVGAGAVAATTAPPVYAYEPVPERNIYIQPTACHIERQIVNGYWRRIQVCD